MATYYSSNKYYLCNRWNYKGYCFANKQNKYQLFFELGLVILVPLVEQLLLLLLMDLFAPKGGC